MNRNLNLREELISKAIESFKKSFDITANRLGIGSEDAEIEIIFTLNGNNFRKSFDVETNRPNRSVIGQLILKQTQLQICACIINPSKTVSQCLVANNGRYSYIQFKVETGKLRNFFRLLRFCPS